VAAADFRLAGRDSFLRCNTARPDIDMSIKLAGGHHRYVALGLRRGLSAAEVFVNVTFGIAASYFPLPCRGYHIQRVAQPAADIICPDCKV
jgi:hypothetical protein